MPAPSLTIFGIRHHGPGCARSLRAALETLEPDILLMEGPPDAADVLPLLIHPDLHPPVALMIYVPESPRNAAFYPFATYSPEWQALHYALQRGIPARFMDLPQAISLAEPAASDTASAPDTAEEGTEPEAEELRDDPIGMLAQAAGYADHEAWWERQVEQRQDATGLFAGIMEAMTTLRETAQRPGPREKRREAHMRQIIRQAQREGFQRLAVVCGAWHAPVLAVDGYAARADAALLSGLRRVKVQATWVPWTNSRLAYRGGYGAGVASPGWYEHLWTASDRVTIRWISHAARLLRDQDLDASPSSVIEAVRLADTLAALRGLSMPGLAELQEAIQTVLCMGDPAPMSLIRTRLEIGERLGRVPAEAPIVPLQRDLDARMRRLRLQPSAESKLLDLDVREETDRGRSHLLHQLRLLGIAWGTPKRIGRTAGTFHEVWQVQWHVEFALAIVEASIWGNTLESAATAYLRHTAETTKDLPRLTDLLDSAILANLPEAIASLLDQVGACAAVSADVRHLMEALPPLARVSRYGDVRGSNTSGIDAVIDGLFERIIVGLPGACAALDDAAAAVMVAAIGKAAESVALLDRPTQRQEWRDVLRLLVAREGIHGLVQGWCCRLLLEDRVLEESDLRRLAGLALSPATPTGQAAAWVEGLLRGSGLLLLQQDGLWTALDRWLRDLSPDAFVEMLPLLRRAFSGFQPPERRAMGEKVRALAQGGAAGHRSAGEVARTIDRERADLVLPVLATILGSPTEEKSDAHRRT